MSNTPSTPNTTRTITLTGRPPVKINEANWPLIASARDSEHDGQVECQANRKSSWFVGVRQHKDGRAIVYAKYTYSTNWQSERDHSAARGVMLPTGSSAEDICRAVREVAEDIAGAECDGNDNERWPTLANDCIADMPAEEVE